jgi:hypothetical protein
MHKSMAPTRSHAPLVSTLVSRTAAGMRNRTSNMNDAFVVAGFRGQESEDGIPIIRGTHNHSRIRSTHVFVRAGVPVESFEYAIVDKDCAVPPAEMLRNRGLRSSFSSVLTPFPGGRVGARAPVFETVRAKVRDVAGGDCGTERVLVSGKCADGSPANNPSRLPSMVAAVSVKVVEVGTRRAHSAAQGIRYEVITKVATSTLRPLEEGDKRSNNMAEKGTYTLVPRWEAPVHSDGQVPPSMIGPQNTSLRGTIGSLFQSAAAVTQLFPVTEERVGRDNAYMARFVASRLVDRSAFRDDSTFVEDVLKFSELVTGHQDIVGKTTLYDANDGDALAVSHMSAALTPEEASLGSTGEGVTQCYIVDHQPLHKAQWRGTATAGNNSRASAPVDRRMGGPTRGRKDKGGLRTGGQEFGGFLAHGVPSYTHQVAMHGAMVVAPTCPKCFAFLNNYVSDCPVCSEAARGGNIVRPVATSVRSEFLFLNHALTTAGHSMLVETEQDHKEAQFRERETAAIMAEVTRGTSGRGARGGV